MKQSVFKYMQVGEHIHFEFNRPGKTRPHIYSISVFGLGRVDTSRSSIFPGLSEWVAHIYAKGKVSRVWVAGFQQLIQTLVPESQINWASTERYLNVDDEKNRLEAEYLSGYGKHEATTLLATFEQRYGIGKKLAEKFDFFKELIASMLAVRNNCIDANSGTTLPGFSISAK